MGKTISVPQGCSARIEKRNINYGDSLFTTSFSVCMIVALIGKEKQSLVHMDNHMHPYAVIEEAKWIGEGVEIIFIKRENSGHTALNEQNIKEITAGTVSLSPKINSHTIPKPINPEDIINEGVYLSFQPTGNIYTFIKLDAALLPPNQLLHHPQELIFFTVRKIRQCIGLQEEKKISINNKKEYQKRYEQEDICIFTGQKWKDRPITALKFSDDPLTKNEIKRFNPSGNIVEYIWKLWELAVELERNEIQAAWSILNPQQMTENLRIPAFYLQLYLNNFYYFESLKANILEAATFNHEKKLEQKIKSLMKIHENNFYLYVKEVKAIVTDYRQKKINYIKKENTIDSIESYFELYQMFVQHLLDVYSTDDPNVAFRKAAAAGDLENIKKIWNFIADVNAAGPGTKKTALHQAVINKHIEIVRFLLAKNANVILTDAEQKSALDYADSPEIKQLLELEEADASIQQPFHIVIGENHLRGISIQTVHAILEKFKQKDVPLDNIVVCLEERMNSRADIIKNFQIQREKYKITHENAKAGNDYQTLIDSFPSNSLPEAVRKLIFYSTFGIKRFNAYIRFLNFAVENNIQIIGMDDSIDRNFAARNNCMSEHHKVLKTAGKSTITVVGIRHITDEIDAEGLYSQLNLEIQNPFRFYLIHDTTTLPPFPKLESAFQAELQADRESLTNALQVLNPSEQPKLIEEIHSQDANEIAMHIIRHSQKLQQQTKQQAQIQLLQVEKISSPFPSLKILTQTIQGLDLLSNVRFSYNGHDIYTENFYYLAGEFNNWLGKGEGDGKHINPIEGQDDKWKMRYNGKTWDCTVYVEPGKKFRYQVFDGITHAAINGAKYTLSKDALTNLPPPPNNIKHIQIA